MRRAVQCVKPCISSLRNPRLIKTSAITQSIHQSVTKRSFSGFISADQAQHSLDDRVRGVFEQFSDETEAGADENENEGDDENIEWLAPTLSERLVALPQLYTTVPIEQQDSQSVGQYFLLSPEELARAPASLKAAFDVELSLSNGYMMMRESYIPLTQSLASYNTPKGHFTLRKPLGIDGLSGTGKTAALYYLYQWAVANNWLTVHVNSEDFMREKLGWLTANPERDGIMDQAMYTQVWLKQLADLQGTNISRIPLTDRTDVDWTPLDNQTSSQSSSRNLLDLLHLALVDLTQAPRILYQFVEELRHQTKVPVLVMIDNLNSWDSVSDFIDPTNNYKALPARRLALVDAWSVFQHVSPALGTSVFATTHHANQQELTKHFNLNKVRAYRMQPYNDVELKHALVHYHISGVMLESIDEELIGRLKGLSGALPKQVQIIAKQM